MSSLHRLPEILPPADSPAWSRLVGEMRRYLLSDLRGLSPPVVDARVFIAHPAQAAIIAQLREIHNAEAGDAALPRVWRWEHQVRLFWVIELPPGLSRERFRRQFV